MLCLLILFLFTIFYVIVVNSTSILREISDAFFLVGLAYFLLGCIVYVRNTGFFKSFSYFSYKREIRQLKDGGYHEDVDNVGADFDEDSDSNMSFVDFVQKKYSVKWENAIFFKVSIPTLVISFILAAIQ